MAWHRRTSRRGVLISLIKCQRSGSLLGVQELYLGDDRIDMLDPVVARFFRSIANDCLLPRLEVVALRLLGCETAVSPTGKRTLRLLARTLRVSIFGSLKPLMKSHYDKLGFNPAFARILVEASEVG